MRPLASLSTPLFAAMAVAAACLTALTAVEGLPWELGGSDTSPGRFAAIQLAGRTATARENKAEEKTGFSDRRFDDGYEKRQLDNGNDRKVHDGDKSNRQSDSESGQAGTDTKRPNIDEYGKKRRESSTDNDQNDSMYDKKRGESKSDKITSDNSQRRRQPDSSYDNAQSEDANNGKKHDRYDSKQADDVEDKRQSENQLHGRKEPNDRGQDRKLEKVNRRKKLDYYDDKAVDDGSYDKEKSDNSGQRKLHDEYDSPSRPYAKKSGDANTETKPIEYARKLQEATNSYESNKVEQFDSISSKIRESDVKPSASGRSRDVKAKKMEASDTKERRALRGHFNRNGGRIEKLGDRAASPQKLERNLYEDLLAEDGDSDDLLLDELLGTDDIGDSGGRRGEDDQRARLGPRRGLSTSASVYNKHQLQRQ